MTSGIGSAIESYARFRATFEQAAIGMAHVGADGRWLEANQRMCEIVGYDPDELSSLTLRDLTHPEDLELDLQCIQRVMADHTRTYSLRKRYVRKDGTPVWTDLTSSLVRDEAGNPKYFIKLVRLVSTEHPRAVGDRSGIRAVPRRKIEPAEQPLADVVHDLNDLLFVVLSYAELAMSELSPSTRIGQDLGEIHRAAQRAHDLTKLLVSSRRI